MVMKRYKYDEIKNENGEVVYARFESPEYRAILAQLSNIESYTSSLIAIRDEYKESDDQDQMDEIMAMIDLAYKDIARYIQLKNSFEENEFEF